MFLTRIQRCFYVRLDHIFFFSLYSLWLVFLWICLQLSLFFFLLRFLSSYIWDSFTFSLHVDSNRESLIFPLRAFKTARHSFIFTCSFLILNLHIQPLCVFSWSKCARGELFLVFFFFFLVSLLVLDVAAVMQRGELSAESWNIEKHLCDQGFFLYIYGASFKWQIEEKRKCAGKRKKFCCCCWKFSQFLQLKLSVLWVFCRIWMWFCSFSPVWWVWVRRIVFEANKKSCLNLF